MFLPGFTDQLNQNTVITENLHWEVRDKTNNTPYGFGQWFRVKSRGRKNFGELWMRVMSCVSQGVETRVVNS